MLKSSCRFLKMFRVDVETLCEDLFDKLDEVKVEFLGVKMRDVAVHTLCKTMVDNFAEAEVELLGPKPVSVNA